MERIKLSKAEKIVLRLAALGKECPGNFSRHIFIGCNRSLVRKGLVRAAFIEGGDIEASDLTPEGRCLFAENPQLRNPVDWKWIIATGIAIVGAITGIIALFIACTR